MIRFLADRIVQAAAGLLLLSLIAFLMSRLSGNPLVLLLSPYATQEDYVAASHALGLDRPLHEQYWIFLSHALQGDLGKSLRSGELVAGVLAQRFGASATLALLSVLITLAAGIPMGVASAVYRGTLVDQVVKIFALVGQSVPSFLAGIFLIEVFSVRLGWLPSGTSGRPTDVVLPAVTLSLFGIAGVARLLRSSMLEILESEFIKLARSKGISEAAVVWKHALKNAALPVVSFAGILLVNLLTLAVVVETVFAWPGLGQLSYSAILTRDFPIIQGVVLLAGAISIFVSTSADILYVYLDPRIRI